MGLIYKDFAEAAKLPKHQADKLNDLLADDVMENVEHLSAILRDKKTAPEADEIFATQEAALMAKVQALLGPETAAQYKDYTQNLLSGCKWQNVQAQSTRLSRVRWVLLPVLGRKFVHSRCGPRKKLPIQVR